MRCHVDGDHFLHLQFDIGVDHAVREHVALLQEVTVGIKCFECFAK